MPSLRNRSFFTRKSHYQGQADLHNRKSGLGKQTQQNGLLYEGEWKNGLRHGYGIVYRKELDTNLYVKVYVGAWRNGQKHGLGIKYYKDGKYLGLWEKDQRSGHGFMWFNNGSFYMGEWSRDLFSGSGVFLETNGNRYYGQFDGGRKHGEGVYLHSRTGQIQKGFWKKGVFKIGTIEDWNRNQVPFPTFYPIPEIKLANFTSVYQRCLEEQSLIFNNGQIDSTNLCE
ncbi:MORN repeat-containing protein 3-like [Topomyia yanbarensis]|uniref:MORN repeat-containing protein 3-like n=1 Tax=Topomyia yanbarensis TaxID=2498891 RepID=UPI00273AD7FA|nr:MORN repeat-containing protein 3-like [Topomyia yanbarensis]